MIWQFCEPIVLGKIAKIVEPSMADDGQHRVERVFRSHDSSCWTCLWRGYWRRGCDRPRSFGLAARSDEKRERDEQPASNCLSRHPSKIDARGGDKCCAPVGVLCWTFGGYITLTQHGEVGRARRLEGGGGIHYFVSRSRPTPTALYE